MTGETGRIRGGLASLRYDPTPHWVAMILAIAVGLALAHVHWSGLLVGGALVGLLTANLTRALLAGIGFGLVVLAVWAVGLWTAGSLNQALAMGDITLVAVVIGIGAPGLGSLARGIV